MPWQYDWYEVKLSNRDETQGFVDELKGRGVDGWELAQADTHHREPGFLPSDP
jgi:hypothetical protein